MKEENRKEILTKETVKKELKEVYIHNALIHIPILVALTIFFLLYLWSYSLHKADVVNYSEIGKKLFFIGNIALMIICGSVYAFVAYSVYKFIALAILAHKGKFDIVTDKLVDKEKDGGHKYYITEYELEEIPDHRKPIVFLFPNFSIHSSKKAHFIYKLQFAKHKTFYIPEGKLYRWSDKYRMEHWAVFRWAEICDDFHLVLSKNKILYVYNAKHFELQDYIHDDNNCNN